MRRLRLIGVAVALAVLVLLVVSPLAGSAVPVRPDCGVFTLE